MGREWHYWGGAGAGGKTSKKGGGAGEGEGEKDSANIPTGCMCAVFQLFDFHQFQFPLNHHQQQQHHPSGACHQSSSNFLHLEEPPVTKGVEAPRNSLELEVPDSLSSSKDEDFIMPVGIQIKIKNGDKGPSTDTSFSSEISSSSPGAKTPNLVARLMGLDLLPDPLTYSSPSRSCSSPNPHRKSQLHQQNSSKSRQQSLQTRTYSHKRCLDGTDRASGIRSLPETPRISSARRSDVEHRLSLQINKENISEEVLLSRISSLKRKDLKVEEESRSPGHYARQIVKQVKESVIGRKFGLDITNTVRNREQLQGRRDQQLEVFSHHQFKSSKKMISKNLSTTKVDMISSNGPACTTSTATSCSPRLKFLETQNKPITEIVPCKDHHINISTSSQVNILPQNTKPSTKTNLQPVQDNYHHRRRRRHHHHHHWQQKQQQKPIKKCKKVTEDKFTGPVVPPPAPRLIKKPPQTSDIMIRNRQEETFVLPATTNNIPDKKCSKKTPSSNHSHLNISAPTLLPVKKDPTPPATKVPQKPVSNAQESKRSSQLSSCSSQSYKPQTTQTLDARDKNNNEDNGDMSHNGGVARNITTGGVAAAAAECEYITRILKRTGIDKDTPVSFTRWFSPSHPLDPLIFYYLEHFTTMGSVTACQSYTSPLDRRCNRKLLFHLVDEILVEILHPCINMKPWVGSSRRDRISHMKGSHLVQLLCTKLRSFPCADCRDLEDIDGLIDKDLPPSQLKVQIEVAFGEEGEGIVTEIEKDVVDTLIHETAALILYGDD